MTALSVIKIVRRAGRRKRGEQGLTLIELLVALSLLVLLTGFLGGALRMAHRAFAVEREVARATEVEAAVEVIRRQIAAAFPVTDAQSGRLQFDGRPTILTLTRLDVGRGGPAGLRQLVLRQFGEEIAFEVAMPKGLPVVRPMAAQHVTLLGRVAGLKFSYFGRKTAVVAAAWQASWTGTDRLPELISVELALVDAAPVSFVVACLQRP